LVCGWFRVTRTPAKTRRAWSSFPLGSEHAMARAILRIEFMP
jgi:hypothetical protein